MSEGSSLNISTRDKGILILLSSWLGVLGVDKFYMGKIGLGVAKLLTFGGCGIWALVDNIIYMVSLPQDSEGRQILDRKTQEQVQSGRTEWSSKDKGVLVLLATYFGIFGIDRFYRGQIGLGVAKLLTLGGLTIWALIDYIIYMVGDLPVDFEGKPIADRKTLEALR